VSVRYLALPLAGVAAVLAGVLAFGDLNGSLVYYLTPSEAIEQRADFDDGRRFRLAGAVAPGSIIEVDGAVEFTVVDGTSAVPVAHTGVPPQLFQEGIDVVVEGAWDGEAFRSDTMLIKHDENYYPPGEGPMEAAP
jgi:cytochrome c-type biogenesis protein CcmE